MKTETVQTIIEVSNAASKDSIRMHINGVSIRVESGLISVVATNGYGLCERFVDDPDVAAAIGSQVYFVPLSKIPTLKTIMKPWKKSGGMPFKIEDAGLIIGDDANGTLVIQTCDKQGISFPDYKRVMPPLENYTVKVGLNAAELMLVLKTLVADYGGDAVFTLSINPKGKLAPVYLTQTNVKALLMPCRMDKDS